MTSVLNRIGRTLGVLALAAGATSAVAQGTYPNRPIKLIVPFPAGGGVDLIARTVAEKLSASLGQQVVVDNRPGASGNIGAVAVAKAAPDGYTLLLATTPMTINASSLPFDAAKDFAPVSLLGSSPFVLVVNNNVAKSVKELVEQAKAKPGQFTYASTGLGTQQHLTGEMFKYIAGLDIVHAPYKGAPQALTDMVGGHVQMMFHGLPVVLPFLKSGQLRAVAVARKQRTSALPDVPTMTEAGYPGIDAGDWYGVVAPVGTPKEIVTRLNGEIVKIMNTPTVRDQLLSKGYEPASSSVGQFSEFIVAEQRKWSGVIKQSGIRIN
ncbi:Bug family tripartite tricarboxylate transporter substrate binding protein [Cupriavidus sp. CP313]